MNITFYSFNENHEEVEVKTWKESTHCIIDCDCPEDIFKAGMWVEKHKRTIADYAMYDACPDTPYIEVYKKRK